ncbi:MAG: hypothetical protein WCV50_01100 [Patescibacteria group bacterium]|jgi:hypothetical protein
MLKLALFSLIKFPGLAASSIRLRRERLGKIFKIDQAGSYKVFRETVSLKPNGGSTVTLVIGFRLKIIGAINLLHWFFQRVCVLTTPFWCGFAGFKVKLWMVDPVSKNYMGIYEWLGADNSEKYINFLLPILKFFSVHKSVWYKSVKISLNDYLQFKEHN